MRRSRRPSRCPIPRPNRYPVGAATWPALLGLLLVSACETRTRNNPFDPGNPDTRGVPMLLQAVAADHRVDLSWDLSSFDAPEGIRLLRLPAGPGPWVRAERGRGSGAWSDSSVTNGVTYSYLLQIVAAPGESLRTAAVPATPGASEPWVGDASGYGLARLTPDGRNLLFRVDPYREILGLDLGSDGTLWAADFAGGAILRYDSTGAPLSQWAVEGADALSLDQAQPDEIWIGSFTQGTAALYRQDGELIWSDPGAGLVEAVRSAPGGGAWVGSRTAGLRRLSRDHFEYQVPGVQWPVDLEVEPDSAVWIVDRGTARVLRLAANGFDLKISPVAFVSPTSATLDGAGGLWVADPGRGGISHLDSALAESAFLAVGAAQFVTWDPVGGSPPVGARAAGPPGLIWVTFPDSGLLEVLQVLETAPYYRVEATLDLGGAPAVVRGYWR